MIEIGGAGILNKYDDSMLKLLTSIFPEHIWLPWKFKRISNGFWNNHDSKKQFMQWVSKELKINEMKDWYKVSIRVYNGVNK